MIRFLRHDPSVLREEDGAVEFRISAQMFRLEFTSSQYWSIRAWLNYLQKGGGPNKRFQYFFLSSLCWYCPTSPSNSTPFWKKTHQAFAEHIYHVGNSHDTHSIIQSGLIPDDKDVKKGRHATFSTAVNPMYIDHDREKDYDVTKSRIAVCKNKWKEHQNTVYWCNLKAIQGKDQTLSSFTSFYLRCVLRRWRSGSQDKNCTAKRISLLLHRKELNWRRTWIINVKTP